MNSLKTKKIIIVMCALFLGIASEASADAVKVYWVDRGGIQILRSNPDGSNIEQVIGGVYAYGLSVDSLNRKLYYGDEGEVNRSDLDGSNVETLVSTGIEVPYDIDLDLVAGKMYWSDISNETVKRADLDGTNIETLFGSPIPRAPGIAVDNSLGKFYVTEFGGPHLIHRANLDGSGQETILDGLDVPFGIDLDVAGGMMYWAEVGAATIKRANLDGGDIETLVTNTLNPTGLALDLDGGKMYWAESNPGKLLRANLDGSGIEEIVSFANNPGDVDLLFQIPEPTTSALTLAALCLVMGRLHVWK